MYMELMVKTEDLLAFLNHYFGMEEISSFKPPKNTPNFSSNFKFKLIGSNFDLSIIENYLGWVVEFSLSNGLFQPSGRYNKPYFKVYIWNGGLYQDILDDVVIPIKKEDIFPNLVQFLHKHHPEIIRDVKLDDLLNQ